MSKEGRVVEFNDELGTRLRFDVRSLQLSGWDSSDGLTLAPKQDGLSVSDWRNGGAPALAGRPLPFDGGVNRSLAIAPDGKRLYLGSTYALAAYDEAGAVRWRRPSRSEVWAVNATIDGRTVVAAYGDGTIRWHRADDGRELLALQVLPNLKDWVLWTPEGFYEATPGAENVLKWVVNHGPDAAAGTLQVSAIPRLHRRDALPCVLSELETARALGVADIADARLEVHTATGAAKPPGAVLHVLAIGIDHFGDKAGALHLDYAVDDARDVANALLASQKTAPGKPSLYADVKVQYLTDATEEKPTREMILKAMDAIARDMRKSGSDEDVALVLFSSHGAMVGDEFYPIPFGVDIAAIDETAVSATDFARKVQALAEAGRVILLIDACHSGAVGLSKPDASVLRKLVTMDTVTVLTSSKKDESSLEDKRWRHGAFTRAFLDALRGGADTRGVGTIRMGDLAMAMEAEVPNLTEQKQHIAPHVNFLNDEVLVDNR